MKWLCWAILLASFAPVKAQVQGPIDPTWVYITPVQWQNAPRWVHQRTASVRIAILYPEGQYVEVGSVLIERKDRTIGFSAGDGLVIRSGSWSRTDEQVIRIHSRDVFREVQIVDQPLPGPFSDDTCGLEGSSKDHLAKLIHCRRISFSPLRIDLDLRALRDLAHAN